MLSPKIVQLLLEVEKLSLDEQDALAEDLYADLVDARFRHNITNDIPMPQFEALVQRAKEQQAHGEYISLEEWLAEDEA